MNILILTGKFGMGHWSASQSLRQRLLRAFPDARVEVEDFFAYAMPDASDALYKGFSLLVTLGSGLYNTYYKCTENIAIKTKPPFESYFQDKLLELLAQRRPDAVVCTHPTCAQLMADYKRETGAAVPLVTCVTDLTSHSEWLNEGTDCYLVGAPDIRDALVEKGVEPERILVTGIPVKPEFQAPPRRGGERERRLLIMGGGLGLLPRKDSFYEALDALPGVRTTLITGGNQKLYDRLHGRYGHIEVLGFTDKVYEYMARADLLLSKPGGITLFETITSELPILAWEPFLQQEINNARFITRYQIGRTASKEPEACIEAIKRLLYDDRALERMSRNMRALKGRLEGDALARRLSALIQSEGVCA